MKNVHVPEGLQKAGHSSGELLDSLFDLKNLTKDAAI